jgi:ribonuclease HI
VTATRRSHRLAAKSGNERALRREEKKRRLAGTHAQRWPPPSEVTHGEVHVYTDGSASGVAGDRKAGCGVWFAEGSPFNISTSPGGRQTSNRAELMAIILALRKAKGWPTLYKRLTVHSDSMHCVDGVNKWLRRWKVDGWTRNGSPLRNLDLWKLLSRVLDEHQESKIKVVLLHVPAHVGVYDNEKTDRLAKAVVRRARRNASRKGRKEPG